MSGADFSSTQIHFDSLNIVIFIILYLATHRRLLFEMLMLIRHIQNLSSSLFSPYRLYFLKYRQAMNIYRNFYCLATYIFLFRVIIFPNTLRFFIFVLLFIFSQIKQNLFSVNSFFRLVRQRLNTLPYN